MHTMYIIYAYFYYDCCTPLHACVYNVHTSITTAVLPYMHVCTMYILLSRLLYSPTCMCVQCTYFYHDCCTPLHACVSNVHTSITTAVLPYMHVCTMYILLSRLLYSPTCMCVQCTYFYHDCCTPLHACVYNVHTSITTAVLPYMHVCTMYILLSRLLYSPTCMCVQCTYFYHDCCTPLHACVYNVHTSITTAVLPYMHVCTMYILLSRLLYSPTCMCVQCTYFYHDCCTPLHACVYNVHTSITTAVLPYMHVCTVYILLSRLLYSPTCMCVQCTYFYHDCCTPLHACVYNVHTSITTAALPYMHVCTMYILLSRLLYPPTCMCVQCTYFYHDCCTPLHACVYSVHTSITTAVLPYMHVCTMYILLSRLLYSPTCMCVQCTYFYHDCCTPLHACVYSVHTSITTAVLPYMHVCTMYILLSRLLYSPTCMCVQCTYFYHDCCTPLHACVYSVHTSITTAVLPYMHVCTVYILLSRLLYSPTCMCVQCTYFYHDCCTPLHACVYSVHTSITTAVLPYMHVCTVYILLSRLLYSPTCMCAQCTYFYHDCCTPLHACVHNVHTSITTAVLPYMHVCTMYILLSRLLHSPTCMCVQCTYFYHDCCTPLHACVYNVRTSITTAVLPYMHVCTMYILLSRLLYSLTCMCVQCTYFYHDCCTPLHACVYNVHTSITTAACTPLHACVYNVHTSITTAVLPYMHVCTMYILLSQLLYSPTCMCAQCTYFYHDCCTSLHACVYNVHTSITTAVLPYMHVCTMYILLSRLLYSPTCMCVQCTYILLSRLLYSLTCMCVQCTYFYHDCCTPHACVYNVHTSITTVVLPYMHVCTMYILLSRLLYSPTCMCVQCTYFYHDCCTPLQSCVYNVHSSITTAVLPYMHVCTMYILLSRLLYSLACMCVQCTYFYHDCCTPLHACVYNVHTSITTAVLPCMHVCTMYILLSRLLYSPACMCVQCTYFYHDCCTPLHACVYNVRTSITTAVPPRPYMHVCTMSILLSRLMYSLTCMCVQCPYFYHDCCTPLHACVYNVHTSITTAVLPYMHVCTMYILLSRLLYSPTCMCVQCTYFYHVSCTPLHPCVYNVHTSITTAVLTYMHVCTMYILLSRLLYSPTCMCVQCTYFYHDCCTPLHACVYNVHTSITTAVLPYMHVCIMYILLSRLLYSLTCVCVYTMYNHTRSILPHVQVPGCHWLCWWWELWR